MKIQIYSLLLFSIFSIKANTSVLLVDPNGYQKLAEYIEITENKTKLIEQYKQTIKEYPGTGLGAYEDPIWWKMVYYSEENIRTEQAILKEAQQKIRIKFEKAAVKKAKEMGALDITQLVIDGLNSKYQSKN